MHVSVRGRYADIMDVVDDVGKTAVRTLDTGMAALNHAIRGLTENPRSWNDEGNWLYIFEFNPKLNEWIPVSVQKTSMSLKKRIGILLAASFNPGQPQFRTSLSELIRSSSPDQWRIRTVPEEQWLNDKGEKLSFEEAEKFYVLKYRTYRCDQNPYGRNEKNSPLKNWSQKKLAESVEVSPRFCCLSSPSKAKRGGVSVPSSPTSMFGFGFSSPTSTPIKAEPSAKESPSKGSPSFSFSFGSTSPASTSIKAEPSAKGSSSKGSSLSTFEPAKESPSKGSSSSLFGGKSPKDDPWGQSVRR